MSYLKNFDNLVRDERQMKACTGVSTKEFEFLVPHFKKAYQAIKKAEYEKRSKRGKKKRRLISEPTGKLDTIEKQLFFILNYLKTYPTFDIHAVNFNYSRGRVCEKVHESILILAMTLKDLNCAPIRKIKDAKDFQKVFGKDIDRLIIDATERRHFRHKNNKKQKDNYSGKKKPIQRKI